MRISIRFLSYLPLLIFCFASIPCLAQDLAPSATPKQMPNSKLLGEVPGHPQRTNNFPSAIAISPDNRFAVLLNSGYGAYTSGEKQSLTVLNLDSNALTDFPDDRLGQSARQTYFLGLAFSLDGHHLYASMSSITDPLGKQKGSTGNGIAVYTFENGKVTPERFISIAPRTKIPAGKLRRDELKDVTYPAGFSVLKTDGEERILVACDNSDEAILLNVSDGKIIHRFDLSVFRQIPGSLPYTTVTTKDGKRGFVSLWNASTVVELDLLTGRVLRMIPLRKPSAPQAGGSHPTALLLNKDDSLLYVALTNRDEIAVVNTRSGKLQSSLSTKLPGQKYGGSDPEYLAFSTDGKTLFSANAISDSVAVFDVTHTPTGFGLQAQGFVPTEWYPTVVATTPTDLLIGTAKGRGSAPNSVVVKKDQYGEPKYQYVAAITQGSLARLALSEVPAKLPDWTAQAVASNLSHGNGDKVLFASGENRIRHVIYIIKENRTYDQVFGDLPDGNGDSSLTMYGEAITPNQHALARQFGILDNFYDSGDVSGDGHIWSTSASVSDYVEKTWPIAYRGGEYTYDSEGQFLGSLAAAEGLPDAAEPTGGFLWKNFATHGISYRHYGEFILTRWCNESVGTNLPTAGPPKIAGVTCPRTVIKKGEPLPKNVGDPRGGPSPYAWDIPVPAKNIAAEIELRGHFDPLFPDFEVAYPDQFRVDEFLNEFNSFVANRNSGKDTMQQFTLLRLGNDHTEGGRINKPTPSAAVSDNDLAVGRVVDAISHSPYWDDTAILILEDDAQSGPDHVDSHRSTALVISKYAPLPESKSGKSAPFVDHHFYTTVNMVRTIEALLGAPPMNVNDSRAAVMAPLFSGPGNQPPFAADYRNRDNGMLYQANTKEWKEGDALDFSHADAADTAVLNKFLWQDRMGDSAMPAPNFTVFPAKPASSGKSSREERDRD